MLFMKYLLKSDVQVKADGLSGVTRGREGELQAGWRRARQQLHRVRARIIAYLNVTRAHFETPAMRRKQTEKRRCLLTAKSETKVHCWMGWL